jgi:hypothetical protein
VPDLFVCRPEFADGCFPRSPGSCVAHTGDGVHMVLPTSTRGDLELRSDTTHGDTDARADGVGPGVVHEEATRA